MRLPLRVTLGTALTVGASLGLACAGTYDSSALGASSLAGATVDALKTADEHGCNVLLTHHPVYIAPPDGFCPASRERPACSAVVYEAARLGISVISLHTNLDRSVEAREALAGALGITASSSIEHPDDPGAHGLGCLCSCDPVTLGDFAERAQTVFGTIAVVWGDPSALIERPAVLGGSLGDFGELALGAGADAIVTGEVGYPTQVDRTTQWRLRAEA